MKAVKITANDQEVLELLKKDLIDLSSRSKSNLINFYRILVSCIVNYIKSLKEYSRSNIRARGLSVIIEERASRFFRISTKEENKQKSYKKKVKLSKRIFKTILFPIYLLVVAVDLSRNKEKKCKKNVNYINRT